MIAQAKEELGEKILAWAEEYVDNVREKRTKNPGCDVHRYTLPYIRIINIYDLLGIKGPQKELLHKKYFAALEGK